MDLRTADHRYQHGGPCGGMEGFRRVHYRQGSRNGHGTRKPRHFMKDLVRCNPDQCAQDVSADQISRLGKGTLDRTVHRAQRKRQKTL